MADIPKSFDANEVGFTIKDGSTGKVQFDLPLSSATPSKVEINLNISVGTTKNFAGQTCSWTRAYTYVLYNGKYKEEIMIAGAEGEEGKYYFLTSGTKKSYLIQLSSIPEPLTSCTLVIQNVYCYGDKGGSITVNSATITEYLSSSSSSGESTISSLSPSSGTFPISQSKVFSWKCDSLGVPTEQYLYYRKSSDSTWKTITISTGTTSYTFGANTFAYGYYYWKVRVVDTFGYDVESETVGVQFGSVPSTGITYPSENAIWRSIANEFQWSYRDSLNLEQTAWELGYKLTSTATWTVISGSDSSQSYTFDANFFQYARYNIRIRVKNEDGLWSDYEYKEIQAGSIPKVSINYPSSGAVLRKSQDNVISWDLDDTLYTGQKAYTFEYRLTNSTEWISNTYTSTESMHSIPAESLDMGEYSWRIKVENNDNNWTAYTDERTFTYGVPSTLTLTTPEDGANVRLLADLIVSWSSENDYDLPQKAFEIGYRIEGSEEWQTITGETDESYTFESGSLTHDYYEFRLRIQNTDDYWTAYTTFTLQVGSEPSLEITYPFDCNIKKDIKQIFTWQLTDSLSTGQLSYEMDIRPEDETEWTSYSAVTSNEYIEFEADTFEAGDYQWRVRVTNNDGIRTDYIYATFTIIGVTDAPVITEVTQSAIPTITWTVDSQDTFEFELYSKNSRIYSSGVQKGYEVRSFTPNIMIPDGNYVIKIRAMNEYGYFTEWMTYSFVLSTEKPSAVDCYIFANSYHGVTIARSLELDEAEEEEIHKAGYPPEAIYVLRRINGETEWTILGKLSTTDETVTYDDNTVQKNVEYEYALRHYKSQGGYVDSDSHLIMLNHKGIIIYDGNEYVNLYLDEDVETEISHAPSKSFTYSYMIGREYPVRESSEWMSHSTKFTFFGSIEQYNKLYQFYKSNDSLWFKGKDFSFACSIDSISITEALLGTGYDIEVALSRISEEELELF